jgi:hypothetical protein
VSRAALAALSLAALSLAALSLAACDARPLVDKLPKGKTFSKFCTLPTPSCDELEFAPTHVPIAADAFDRGAGRCAAPATVPCGADPLSGEGNCASAVPLVVDGVVRVEGATLSCADYAVELLPNSTLELVDPTLSDVSFTVNGADGSTVRILGGTLNTVHVALRGSAWLEIREHVTATELSVDVSPEVEGASVWVEDAAIQGLRVKAHTRSEVLIESSAVAQFMVTAGALTLDASAITGAQLKAVEANFVRSELNSIDAELTHTVFVVTNFRESALYGCATLETIGGVISQTHLSGCATPMDFLGTLVYRSTVRGEALATGATFSESVLSPGEGGTVWLEAEARAERSAFCDTDHVSLTTMSVARCNVCTPEIGLVEAEDSAGLNPQCPSLDEVLVPLPPEAAHD